MTPQSPDISLYSSSALRPLVAAIALGLIWMGAVRMPAPAQSRYTTASVLSVVLLVWLAAAQYLASANAYFASTDTSVPSVLFGLMIPLIIAATACGYREALKPRLRDTAAFPCGGADFRIGGGIFLVLWALGRLPWQFALPREWDVTTGIGDRRSRAVGAKGGWRSQRLAWSLFWHRRPRRGDHDGGNDLPGLPHLLAFEAPNLLITSYPLVMVPTFVVPLALMLHGFVLLRLRRESNSTSRLALRGPVA